jgi:UDP-glucose 4-epimerase
MKVLITGGAGFIGSNVQSRLLELGHNVVVVDNLVTGFRRNVDPAAAFYELDIRDEALLEAFERERPDAVIHHAAQMDVRASVRDPQYDASVNIQGSLNLLEACRATAVSRFLYASTGGAVYGEPEYLPVDEQHPIRPMCPYGVSKHTLEHYLHLYHQLYGLQYLILRYPNVYGPRQDPHGEAGVVAIFSLQMLRGQKPTIFGDGTKTRDYVYVDDIVEANVLGLSGTTVGTYNLGWGRPVTDLEVFDEVRRATGVTLEPCYAAKRLGEIDHICLDASKARMELEWKPVVSFRQGVDRAVDYYRREGGKHDL